MRLAQPTGGLPPFAVVDRFNNSETVNVLHAKGVAKLAAYREWFVVRNTPRRKEARRAAREEFSQILSW